jgi:hypothetical protein
MAVLKLRKSGFEDAFFFIAVVFTIAIFILILSRAWSEMKTPLEDSLTESLPAGSDVNITKTFNNVSSTIILFNTLLPFILIGLFAFVFIGVSVYYGHPMMIVVGLIILSIAILLGAIYSNIYTEIAGSDEFSTQNAELGIQAMFMEYLPFIILLVFIGIIALIIYSRGGGGQTI